MKNNNIKKRWFYDLTEKQVYKIIAVIEVVVFIPMSILVITTGDLVLIVPTLLIMLYLGLLIYAILWLNPLRHTYLDQKQHNEEIVPKVREKFGLSSEFKEVLSNTKSQILHYFAKETEDGILISQRDSNGNEITSTLIANYDFFDLLYRPKQ